jgi:hypothetical protein
MLSVSYAEFHCAEYHNSGSVMLSAIVQSDLNHWNTLPGATTLCTTLFSAMTLDCDTQLSVMVRLTVSFDMLRVMLGFILLSVIMLGVIMLGVVMLSNNVKNVIMPELLW